MSDKLVARAVGALERLGKVLGALYAGQNPRSNLGERADKLHRCGFTNKEIATMLGSTANAVGVALHGYRKRQKVTLRRKRRAK